ncbi:MAG TPA: thioredoxin domain-containing protein [Acidimicrobiales bacterium]|nr:thioredoxin domain-containing protein [Acidimicrobiales bacterium]
MSGGEACLSLPVGPDDHALGPENAPLTIVEYGDYQCPYCGQAFPIVQALQREFGDSLRFVFRNLPLADMHPHAEQASEMAEAVGTHGRFWEMHDLLYEHQRDLEDKALLEYAAQTGVDTQAVVATLESGEPRERVQRDLESAIRSGANGTPTFFVNGERYDGSWAYEPFAEYLTTTLHQ